MTINQMRCFSTVAKELNFAKAAKQLYISQPAVSHQIQLLENELGVQLFHRSSRSVSLTPAGVSLFQDVDDILERIELVSQRAVKAADSTVINVGCVSVLALPWLPEVFREFCRLEPNVMIKMIDVPQFDYKGFFDSQQLDLIFTPKSLVMRVPELSFMKIKSERLYCVVPEGHRFEGKDSLTYSDLGRERMIMLDIKNCPPVMAQVQQFISSHAENILINYSSSTAYACPMILGGIGIAIMPGFVIPEHDGIRKIPFEIDRRIESGFEYGLAYHRDTLSHAQKTFIDVVRKQVCEK